LKILINRTDAIGDLLLTLPMANFIKEELKAEVHFIVSQRAEHLLKNYSSVDRYFTIDRSWSFVRRFFFFLKLIDNSYDAYVFVGGDRLPNFVSFIKRIKIRGGLISKLSTFFFLNKGSRQSRSLVEMHESEYNLSLLQCLGLNYKVSQRHLYAPHLALSHEEKINAKEELISLFKCERPYVLIHPGMSGHTLNWPLRHYADFIREVKNAYPDMFNFLISFTPSDERYINPLRRYLSQEDPSIVFYDGSKKGLRHFLSLLSHSSFVLAPSTGITHMANSLSIPQVAIYSPIKVQSSMRWGPFKRSIDQVAVVAPEVVCGEEFKCIKDNCLYYDCMNKIEVSDVFKHFSRLLKLGQEEHNKT
jgi:heptosyltransferase III